jgi:hypothetical protein
MYLAYAQPAMSQSHLQSYPLSYSRQPDQLSYTTGPLYPQRDSQEDNLGYISERPRQIPEVTDWNPQQGPQGTKIFFYLISAFELDPSLDLHVEFASRRCTAALTRIEHDSACYRYALSTEVPAFSLTGWASTRVPIKISAQDQSGNEIVSVKLEEMFTYTDATTPMSQSVSRKRRASDNSEVNLPVKRVTARSEPEYESRAYSYLPQSTPSYIQQSPHLVMEAPLSNMLPAYTARTQSHSGSQQGSPRRLQQHITSAPVGQQSKGRSPQTPSWTGLGAGQLPNSPSIPGPTARLAALASPSIVPHPTLVRTSTMQHPTSPNSAPSGPSTPANFNPYAMYPQKAILTINGELESMTEGWTEDERTVKRRLVQFWRSQSGSTISTTFKPVAPEDRQPNSICISCIWWESRNAYYVTSVDTIYLLESLVAVRFTVEEKNRIRRNLEGFRPLTVSKGKSDSEDFFKLIMGFPNPKPRNIEKDVKVFPWKILSLALKKIISKYVSQAKPPPLSKLANIVN